MNFVTPSVYLIAETVVTAGMEEALRDLDVADWTSDAPDSASLLTEFAGKSCYMSFDPKLNANLTKTGGRNNHDYIQQGIIGNHHGSVLEHSTVTFFIKDVSRVVTHELVRHRAGVAVSQTSGRYVRNDELSFYLPKAIAENPAAKAIFQNAIEGMEVDICALAEATKIDEQKFNKKKELTSAFRRIIGNGQANHITVTANHRAWRHMIEMRTDPHAEEEIRVVFAEISRQLREGYPAIYADAQITVEDGIEVTTFEHSKV